ncbi:dicer-like protein 1 [Plakobranchus ocellatus]|uniref:Dicer-like protein 1 n=1 Tax=Plakobranchus ocellatus TaxID=259542 RepID=A0AAV4B254_9GAST|nr:dicer-like protein 1 [Plakobranchus ocellatus]
MVFPNAPDENFQRVNSSESPSQAQGSNQNDLKTDSADAKSSNESIYFLQNGIGKCFICQVDLTSQQHANQHLSGQKHRKKLAAYQVGSHGGPVFPASSQSINRVVAQSGPVPNHYRNMFFPVQDTNSSSGARAENSVEGGRQGPDQKDYIMNGSKGFCFVCNISLTSLEHADSHLNGQKHKKKSASMERSSGGPAERGLIPKISASQQSSPQGVYMCALCEVPFSCLANAKEHFRSSKHIKNLDREKKSASTIEQYPQGNRHEQYDDDMTDLKKPYTSAGTTPERYCSPSVTSQNSNKVHEIQYPIASVPKSKTEQPLPQHVPEKDAPSCANNTLLKEESRAKDLNRSKSIELTIGNLSCNHTEKEVNSKKVFAVYETTNSKSLQSISSSEHSSITDNGQQTFLHQRDQHYSPRGAERVPLQQEQQPQSDVLPFYFDGSRGFCNVCNVELTSRQLTDQHVNGQKHKKRFAQWEHALQHKVAWQRLSSSSPIPTPDRTRTPTNDSFRHLGLRASPLTPCDSVGATQSEIDAPDETCSFNGIRGFCTVCNIELTSPQHYDQHRLGKPHSRNRQRYILSQQGVVYPLYCDTCKKPFTGQESAQQHFTSARHKIKEEVLGQEGREVERLDGGRMIMRESQIWYVCDICECLLNTRDQFRIHKESPRHKKNVEIKSAAAEGRAISPQGWKCLSPGLNAAALEGEKHLAGSAVNQNVSRSDVKEHENVLKMNRQHLVFKPHDATNSAPLPEGVSKDSSSSKISSVGSTFSRKGPLGQGMTVAESNSHPVQTNAAENSVKVVPRSAIPTERYSTDVQKSIKNAHFPTNSDTRGLTTVQAYQGGAQGLEQNQNVTGGIQDASANTSSGFSSLSQNERIGSDIARRPPLNRGKSNRSSATPFRGMSTMDKKDDDDSDEEAEEVDGAEEEDREVERANFNITESETALASDLERLKISEAQHTKVFAERSTKQGSRYYCSLCDQHMNAKESYKSHIAGIRHQHAEATRVCPPREYPPICDVFQKDFVEHTAFNLTKDKPRAYQVELLTKAMRQDTVIYLPTGTGKTLIAVMAIGLMLKENKTRPVLFLVDKVLLVLQQTKYICEQFEGKIFNRPNVKEEGMFVDRELNVMSICGGLFSRSSVPIWKHDIVVTTADFCINMLERGLVRWDDFSLVVLDEVHHCHKNHPYLRLFRNYHHLQQQPFSQCSAETSAQTSHQSRRHPKVLGLSASPASKQTVDQTYHMLKNLLANLGGAHIAMVEEEAAQLEKYQSNAKIHVICVPMSDKEKEFTFRLLEYSLKCYIRLARMCPELRDFRRPPCSYFAAAVQDDETSATAESLMMDMEPLEELKPLIFAVSCPIEFEQQPDKKALFEHLRIHLDKILYVINDVAVNSGDITEALLGELKPSEMIQMFEKEGLPCTEMYRYVQHFKEHGSKDMTMHTKLLETLNNSQLIDWSDKACKALVLVQRRQEAKQLADKLKMTSFVQDKQLKVAHLVGHGKGAQDGGQTVKKQKNVLDKQEKYPILVATAVMEEGIDFQTLQLVVSMNPPTTVRALVQIRGRARRKNSHFVILCKVPEEETKLRNLLDQEKHMQEAARRCLREDG